MANEPQNLENYSIKINDYNPNAFCLIRVELDENGEPCDWTFLYCNDALARLEGKSREELVGKRFFDVFPGGNRKWLKYYYEAAYEGKVASFDELSEEIHQYLHIEAYPVGEPGLCTCTLWDVKKDVYEKRQNERQITESQNMLAALTADYLNVYVIEPETDRGMILKLDGYIINGIKETPKNFVYSTILRTYANDRVCDEDREEFLDTVLPDPLVKSFSDKRERLELNYHVPIHGKLEHYSGLYMRISKEGEPLKLIAGFRCIENVISIQNKTRTEGLYNAYAAVSDLYLAMFRVNIKENTYSSIKTTDAVLKYTLPESERYDENLRAIIIGLADKDSTASALEFLDVNTIAERMRGKTHIVTNFTGKVAGACRLHLIRENDDAGEDLTHVILAVEVLEENEFHSVLDVLTENYWNVYWLDLAEDTAKVLKYMDGVPGANLKYGQVVPYTKTVQSWIKSRVYAEDQDRLSKAMDVDYVRKGFKEQRRLEGNYRRIIDGKLQNFQYSFAKVDNFNHALIAFQNIDAIIEEHEERARREREKDREQQEKLAQALAIAQHDKEELQKAQAQLRDSMAITDALSRDYSNVFLVQLKNNRAKIVKEERYNVEEIKGSSGWFDYSVIIRKYIETRVYEPDVEMMLEETKLSKVLAKIVTDADFSIPFRALVGDEIHFLEMRYVSVEGADLVAVGFRYVDAVVKAEAEHRELLQQALATAQQANKAKTTFLNSMSHDIRTPMNAIIGFTALAQTHIDDKSQVQDYLGKISTSSTHLLSLINDILDMSRIESGTVKLDEKAVHIPDLLHDLRTMIQSLVNAKNLNLFIDTQDVIHEDVLTDKLRLNQVLLNIVSNAIKFTQPGGDIMIRLAEKPCSLKHYTTYEFSVKDNGIGMSQEFLGHIFETFTREYSATVSGIQGTGLGMAITKNIVDMMGGEIQVESEEGKGSLFTVTLNLRLAGEPVKSEPIPELLGAKALIVDDDANTCLSVSKMLRDIEMRPDWTTSAKEAIVHAREAAEMKDEYKVYIIDYLMPDMNGIETVRRIRKVISEDVPIIVLTAYDWADFEYEARQAGVTAFVSKPIFMSELRAVLTQPVIREGIEKEKEKKKTYDYSDKRVLLVEDNELNREIATAILEETGMTIDSVNDGDVAVSTINGAPADKYDLILMDVQMPKMDGYTATREIRTLPDNKKANIPIVAMTANAFDEDKRKAFEAGMNGHIIKPISIDEIARVLDEIFAEKG